MISFECEVADRDNFCPIYTGTVIRWRRKELMMSQAMLAKKIKSSQKTVSEIETGKRTGSVQTYMKIAEELCLSFNDMFHDGADDRCSYCLKFNKKTIDTKQIN